MNDKREILPAGANFEKFVIERELGRGGMGVVYLARHKILDTKFAIKVLMPDGNKKNVERFIREAKLSGKVRHKNLVAVHDVGFNEEYKVHYILMEYVSGGSLKERLKKESRISERETAKIVCQISSALEAAYENQMVHRDIKPDNIMFDSEGNAKLADLGIAKNINENDTVLTVEASIFGTPAYMSPEQAKDSHSVDIRSDIYSLGMVAFEMLSGRRVYQGDSMMNVLSQVLLPQEVPSVRLYNASVSEPMASLIAAMVAKDANRRPETPALVIERIKGVEDFLDEQIFNDGAFAAKPPDAHADSDANTFVPSETKTEKTVRSNAAEQRTARLKTEFRALNESAPASPAVSAAPEIDWTAGTVNKAKKQRFSLVMSVVAAVLLLSGVLLWLLFTGDASDAAGAYNAPDYASHIESDETYEQQGSSYVMLIPVGIFSFLSIMIIFAYRKL